MKAVALPTIWPAGPRPGVYVTTEQKHIDALLEIYDEATDGALVYAEDAASHWPASIYLGDLGLFSSGMDRVPSGTLLVLGPLEMNQRCLEDTSVRLVNACLNAQDCGHRVAVLLKTSAPSVLLRDVKRMVRLDFQGGDIHEAILGIVGADGELIDLSPVAPPAWP